MIRRQDQTTNLKQLWDRDQDRDQEFHDFLAEISRAGHDILPRLEKVAAELDANPKQSQPEREALEQEFHALNLKVLQLSEQSRLRQLQKIEELQHRNAKEGSVYSTALESVEQQIRALTARRENIKLIQQKYVEMNAEIGRWKQEMLTYGSEWERLSNGV
jgi:alpha-galactosidase/6-phospho-beta-glucosidase family protein